MTDATAAWAALQIAELVRASDRALLPALAAISSLDATLPPGEQVVLPADDVERLRAVALTLAELAGTIEVLADHLPDDDVTITPEALADAAEDDLARGIVDPARVLLAARVLPAGRGWRALARALRTADTHGAWDELALGPLLDAFRGAEPEAKRRVLAAAELDPATTISGASAGDAARLAAALEEHAPTDGD